MAGSYNRVILVGNLTRDPEIRYTQSGKAVTKFTLAVNNPRNKMIFESLDQENPVTTISSTEVILDAIHKHVTAELSS